VVGEAEPQVTKGKLPLFWRPGTRRRNDLEIAREQVIDRPRVGEAAEAKAFVECLEDAGVLGGPQVEIAAKEQRRVPRPLDRCLCREQDVGCCQVPPVVCRVQVGNAEWGVLAERDACKRHRPALRPPGMDCQLPPLHYSLLPVRFMRLRTR
jgi:hypothetical protein